MATTALDERLDRFEQRVVGRAISEATFTDYEKWIRRFEAWLEMHDVEDPGIAAMEDFDTLLGDGSRTEYPWDNGQGRPAPHSYAYHSRINAISAVKKWVRREYDTRIPEAPSDICMGEAEPFDPSYLDPGQVADDIASADEACDIGGCEAALRLSYDAVMRASELVRIRREDVDPDSGTVYVRATKGSQNAKVGVDRRTMDALTTLMDAHPDRDRLFINSYGRRWTPQAWATHVWRQHEPEGSHALGRHSPIMHRLEGADPPFMEADFSDENFGDVFRRARHTNPSMTVRYARIVGISVPDWAGGE